MPCRVSLPCPALPCPRPRPCPPADLRSAEGALAPAPSRMQIFIVGTAHVSKQSAEEVGEVLGSWPEAGLQRNPGRLLAPARGSRLAALASCSGSSGQPALSAQLVSKLGVHGQPCPALPGDVHVAAVLACNSGSNTLPHPSGRCVALSLAGAGHDPAGQAGGGDGGAVRGAGGPPAQRQHRPRLSQGARANGAPLPARGPPPSSSMWLLALAPRPLRASRLACLIPWLAGRADRAAAPTPTLGTGWEHAIPGTPPAMPL